MKIAYRPEALADIRSIFRHTTKRWGAAQAEHYHEQLHATIKRIQRHPLSGHRYPDLQYFQSMPSGRHLIFYTMASETITICRVLHDRMDITNKLLDEEASV